MTSDRETTRIVRSWIQLGVDRMPERVLDAVLDELPATPQRRSVWPAWRPNQMPKLIAAVAAVAAVVLVAVAGLRLVPVNQGIAGPPPTPSPTASPTPIPTASPSPTAPGSARYQIGAPFAIPFAITMPPGWSEQNLTTGDAQFAVTVDGKTPGWITVDVVDNVFADPCHADAPMSPPVAKTVDAVTHALTHMVGYTAGPITGPRFDGRAAKAVHITNNINTDAAGCKGGPMLSMWTFAGGVEQAQVGTTDQLLILDIEEKVVIIDGQFFPETTPEVRAQITQIVNSIAFNP